MEPLEQNKIDRGVTCMTLIVDASEQMDHGDKEAMDRAYNLIQVMRERFRQRLPIEREPGQEG